MKRKLIRFHVLRFAAGVFGTLFFFTASVLAGPPLVCHVFDIGNAKSLPWSSTGWNLTGTETYSTKNLAADTIAILNGDGTVLVHMETLRRATLYARKDPLAAKELLTRLVARAQISGNSKQAAALANFDAGYLAEAFKQWMGKDEANPAVGLDGYALIKRALQAESENAQMNFAAALVTLQGPSEDHRLYREKALTGAKSDPLLARNLKLRFHGAQSETMAELIAGDASQKMAVKR